MPDTDSCSSDARWWRQAPFTSWSRLANQYPYIAIFAIIIWPNAGWSVANLLYNAGMIGAVGGAGRGCQVADRFVASLLLSASGSTFQAFVLLQRFVVGYL